ncbi:hypothetical protein MC885_005107 [Smutsia gigantea]|nr:hypothetical protein MC885_005107 [Smutsia gigantea]
MWWNMPRKNWSVSSKIVIALIISS